ncbi:MAG: hypothetical protein PVF58_02420 [Candidatus Methanofastidiosia archaeon]
MLLLGDSPFALYARTMAQLHSLTLQQDSFQVKDVTSFPTVATLNHVVVSSHLAHDPPMYILNPSSSVELSFHSILQGKVLILVKSLGATGGLGWKGHAMIVSTMRNAPTN